MKQKFWNLVKSEMKEKRLTQAETAESCGFNWNTFRGWIYKDIMPVVTDAYIIARYLGVDLEYLVTGKTANQKQKIEKIRSAIQQIDKKLARM